MALIKNMSLIEKQIISHLISGVKKVMPNVMSNLKTEHSWVLKKRNKNFITPPPSCFKFHRWAASLKSSQAFAYNIFSGVKNVKFEVPMQVIDRPAEMDVIVEDTNTLHLYEVKFTEFTKNDKIDFKESYFDVNNYILSSKEVANQYKKFIKKVIKHFDNKKIYGTGIKQLCSHLLGILTELEKNNYFADKKIILYSLCFDYEISPKFNKYLEEYKIVLEEFKKYVIEFLIDINFEHKVEYFGFLSASKFIKDNKKSIGDANYNYIKQRYF